MSVHEFQPIKNCPICNAALLSDIGECGNCHPAPGMTTDACYRAISQTFERNPSFKNLCSQKIAKFFIAFNLGIPEYLAKEAAQEIFDIITGKNK